MNTMFLDQDHLPTYKCWIVFQHIVHYIILHALYVYVIVSDQTNLTLTSDEKIEFRNAFKNSQQSYNYVFY